MALVDNVFLGNPNGPSRLMMMQARFQQRQQEEKEHKLFAMLEAEHEHHVNDASGRGGGIQLIPASRTHSNSSSTSQQNSASSLSSSIGSSLASSLGSTGSGFGASGGKVRQMFEDRRNQINGRPPAYAKNPHVNTHRVAHGPTKAGWDRSHPLEPIPSPTKQSTCPPSQHQRSRIRGVSLERGGRGFGESSVVRRSRSQYQMDGDVVDASHSDDLPPPDTQHHLYLSVSSSNTMKPNRSMTSLLDDNQNSTMSRSRFAVRNQSPSRGHLPPASRQPTSSYRDEGENGNDMRNAYRNSERMEQSAAAAAMAAAAEATRRLEREKAQIQAEAKKREDELMNTIRQQQQQLQRLQQAAALAEQKAKAAVAAAAAAASRPSRTSRPPFNHKPALVDETDDFNEAGPPAQVSRPWKPSPPIPTVEAVPPSAPMATRPKLPPKPVMDSASIPSLAPPKIAHPPRKSIFATASASAKDGLVACSLCGRNFAPDRIEKHESICAKTKNKKRKVFDITKMRVQGTEAESFVLRPPMNKNGPPQQAVSKRPVTIGQHILQQQQLASAPSAKMQSNQDDGKKADWRKKHESFIETIRAAKAVQKHLKAGGKISDLPPPPPSDTSDYIQCPHCGRRFAPAAADRHIPKCANIKSNKPK